jgi:hypothetical protein
MKINMMKNKRHNVNLALVYTKFLTLGNRLLTDAIQVRRISQDVKQNAES